MALIFHLVGPDSPLCLASFALMSELRPHLAPYPTIVSE